MKGQLRKSGIDIIGDISWGTHFCQFYQTKEDLIEIVVPYFKAGLENNELCLWVTSEPISMEEAKESLKKDVPDLEIYLKNGQIEIVPETYFYVKEGVFNSERALNIGAEKLSRSIADGYHGLRTSGNISWLRKTDWDNFTYYEEKVDSAIDSCKLIAMCSYPLDKCNATDIIDVVANHQFTLIKREGRWERIESSRRKKVEETAVQAAKNWEYTFDAVSDLISILDTEYRIVRANRAMATRLGMTPEECAGLTCYHIVHGTDKPPSFCPYRQLLADGLEHTEEVCEDCFGGYFLVSVSPLRDSEGKLTGSVHVARDINKRKQAENALRQSEQHVRVKLEKILSPVSGTDTFEIAEIVDIPVIQSLVNDFNKLTHIPVGLNDLKGNVLACIGWQDICTKFHRVHPETCRYCIESDTELSTGISPGEFKLYRCRNNMWDITTPIMVAGQQVGTIFSGQFFFEDEILDYELFRSQARKYGFNEEEYISTLDKVPRLSRETVGAGMAFLMGFANILSQLSYSNLKLARSLTERDILVEELRKSDERFRSVLENSLDSAYCFDFQNNSFDYMSPVIEQITGFSVKEIDAMTSNDLLDRVHPDDRQRVIMGTAQSLNEGFGAHEYSFKCKDGKYRWLADHFSIIKGKTGMTRFRAGIVRDITEKKQVEETLIRSENKFRTLAENSPDLIARFDRQKRHLYVNPSNVEPYGCSPEKIIGKTNGELGMDPELVKFWEEHYEDVFNTGINETMEFHYTSPRGREYYFNTQIIPEFVDGKVASVLAISHDITDIKETEAKLKNTLDNLENLVKERTEELERAYKLLKESEEGLSEAQKMARLGSWEWNITTGELYWSDEKYRIFGHNPQEFTPTYNTFLKYVHPDDRDFVKNAIPEALNVKTYSIDYRIILDSGEERVVHGQGEVTFDEKNKPVRMRGTVQDITERKKTEEMLKKSEERYRIITEQTGQIVYDYDVEKDIIGLAGSIEELTGFTQDEFRNVDLNFLSSLIHPEDLNRFLENHKMHLRSEGGPYRTEYRFRRKNGEYIYLEDNWTFLRDEKITINRILGVLKDITERKKAEITLAKIEIARKKEIHHRIKNNLQVISSLLDLQAEKFRLREHVKNSEVLNAFRESQDRVISIALIHEELHEGRGNDTLNFSPYLHRLVKNLFQTYNLGNADISLNMDLEENIFFDMDTAVPLGLIVNELVSNSLKYAFRGRDRGIILIGLSREENIVCRNNDGPGSKKDGYKNKSFILTVSDNGIGMPESFSIESSSTLGIQLVTILVDQLDGELELKKESGKESGTEFIIRFVV